MAGVRIRNLLKKYDNNTVVNGINIDVKDNELTVLLGPSGCGKTTTLRCIAGLEKTDGGEIYIGETLVNDLPPNKRDIALVFQSYALYSHMSVFDNIAFPLKMRRVTKDETGKRVKEVAELLKISHLLNRKPRQLSGGEAQRTALGRAIIRQPKVFLMDEPLSNLDAKLRVYMRAELKALQRRLGITTIYVTHDQAEAMAMGDRIAVMECGSVQQYDIPDTIYNRPSNTFVAGFIGTPPMNFMDCSFIEKGGAKFLDAGVFKFEIPRRFEKAFTQEASGTEVTLAVRPEDVIVNKGQQSVDSSSTYRFQAELFMLEPLGSEAIVHARAGDCLILAKTRGDFQATASDELYLEFNQDKVHVFDKKTKNLIF